MTASDDESPPERGAQHEALAVFLGRWRATGKAYGTPKQAEDDPKSVAVPWNSSHVGMWHTGEFFLIQDERASTGDKPFDTLSIMGVDAKTGNYFAKSFENHGFHRHYDVSVEGRVWTLTGDRERARIELSADGQTQTIAWEWRPNEQWLPLCDRVAVREE
ncbi:MAG TPA: DUF1579 family protein [Polyangiaceae bacterium]|jgi:hypothetical protein|nr:DUF1579 family protein [Polyangiaceae bacterium]